MNAVERIDFWIEALDLDPAEVWGLIEARCADLEVTLDYALAEDLVYHIIIKSRRAHHHHSSSCLTTSLIATSCKKQ